jgi:hypothetical protein
MSAKRLTSVLVFLFVFTIIPSSLRASHLVGGEMTYESLGNGKLLVTLKLYRDCYNGIPPFPDPAFVHLYNSTNALIDSFPMALEMKQDTLDNTISWPCNFKKNDIPLSCIEVGKYTDTIDISLADNGSLLAFQNCCLPQWVNNIYNSSSSGGSTGFALTVLLADINLIKTNNSPVYKSLPTLFQCLGWPINFNHSATDANNDALRYELITPYLYPGSPPYSTMPYNSGYSLADVMGNNSHLKLDSITGSLTSATNKLIGNYLYGARTHEYRLGHYIGYMERIFMLSVYFGDSTYVEPWIGINETTSQEPLQLYPNPVNDFLSIVSAENQGSAHLSITNHTGKTVVQKYYDEIAGVHLDVSQLRPGIYLIRVSTKEGDVFRKMIKN